MVMLLQSLPEIHTLWEEGTEGGRGTQLLHVQNLTLTVYLGFVCLL